jgi:hypothetical protein
MFTLGGLVDSGPGGTSTKTRADDGRGREGQEAPRESANSPAINQLAESQRKNAKAVKLTKLTAAQMKQLHQHDMGREEEVQARRGPS